MPEEGKSEGRSKGKGRRGERGGASSGGEGAALMMMEGVLDKLKILDYELDFLSIQRTGELVRPFTRIEFAIAGENTSVQFQSFLDICSWLLKECSGDPDFFIVDRYDDPTTSVNKLMLALKRVGFGPEFPAAKLKNGYGEACCTTLDYLTNKALERKVFSWEPPIYNDAKNDVDEDDEVDDEINDDIDDEIEEKSWGAVDSDEEDAMFSELTRERGDLNEVSVDQSQHEIIVSEVDPVLWKKEMERVAPLLRTRHRVEQSEWQAHLEQTRKHSTKIGENFEQSKAQLDVIARDVAGIVEKVRNKEKFMNGQFDDQVREYQNIRAGSKSVEEAYNERNERVKKLTNELATISDQLEDMKEAMSDKGTDVSDTSPVVKIKSSLQQIKTDIQAFELRIGVVSHTLMQLKLKMARAEKKQNRKRKAKNI